jgi:hypothetical protein
MPHRNPPKFSIFPLVLLLLAWQCLPVSALMPPPKWAEFNVRAVSTPAPHYVIDPPGKAKHSGVNQIVAATVLALLNGDEEAFRRCVVPPSDVSAAENEKALDESFQTAEHVLKANVPADKDLQLRIYLQEAQQGQKIWVCVQSALLVENDPSKAVAVTILYLQATKDGVKLSDPMVTVNPVDLQLAPL